MKLGPGAVGVSTAWGHGVNPGGVGFLRAKSLGFC